MRRELLALAALLTASGCATAPGATAGRAPAPQVDLHGLDQGIYAIRTQLANQGASVALRTLIPDAAAPAPATPGPAGGDSAAPAHRASRRGSGRPEQPRVIGALRDEVLHGMYVGALGFYANRPDDGAAALQRAYDLTEDRFTKSATKNVLALATNDMALPYMPGVTERLMVHYYGALNYLRKDDVRGAAVEVRRLSQLLERFDERKDTVDLRTRAYLRYFAASIFDAVGDRADADVALRNAVALAGDTIFPAAPSLTARPAATTSAAKGGTAKGRTAKGAPARGKAKSAASAGSTRLGEVTLFMEHGFAAHVVEQNVLVALTGTELSSLNGDGAEKLVAATTIATRVVSQLAGVPDGGLYYTTGNGLTLGDVGNGQILKMAWPAYRRPAHAAPRMRLLSGGTESAAPVRMVANLSDGLAGDYRRRRKEILVRTTARAVTKFVAAKQAGDAAEKKFGTFGGALAKFGTSALGAALEKADTRSWSVLPGDLGVARIALPAGRHLLAVEVDGKRLEIGEVDVQPGKRTFAVARAWCDPFETTHRGNSVFSTLREPVLVTAPTTAGPATP